MYKRKYFKHIFARLNEPRKFIQVISRPRQTGKTILIQQVMKEIKIPSHYATSDAADATSPLWIEQQWEIARLRLQSLFELGCRYSGQILSYNKILGQHQDAGNTTTLAHYLDLLSSAGMLTGLQKYVSEKIR